MSDGSTAKGRCVCGDIQFSFAREAVISAHHCHCRDCQRSTGSGFATFCMVPDAAITLTGTTKSYSVKGESGGEVTRHFCPECGSQLFSRVSAVPGLAFVKAGCLEDSSWLTANSVFWTDSAQPWAQPAGDVPSHARNPS